MTKQETIKDLHKALKAAKLMFIHAAFIDDLHEHKYALEHNRAVTHNIAKYEAEIIELQNAVYADLMEA